MAIAMKFLWKGRIRQSIKRSQFDLTSLVNYNTKWPTRQFLTAQQLADIETTLTDLGKLLSAKVLK